ncbi:glycosyltransferase involved in cell wall biosynthesis [Paraburkholderia bannensis]|uniref:Glycosyltransferase involved in cell wall biosynthesis n=1 Tax=Paraburkholderia bannensis TaxID=765414 RepID=A0A7W9WT73_9BURK|nr:MULTISPECIES: glycosyltransferase family 1 protein [Paraburkholderia]MBB3258034.1 glycosyltransferase involved in cell wall biosynthesis [Paraburkholderia sp. WP4_3_2]MBB6103047.1 glycosyltransferase involved in cell wall biosynthesis [Paraburkholderia bannensis]
MSRILLDVTRLLTRLYDGLLPTGVDRVGIAYIERYGAGAHAVLSERGFSTVLSEKDSQNAFGLIISGVRKRYAIRELVARACIKHLGPKNRDKGVLLHTSHNGMEFQRYYNAMKKRGLRPVFMVHDLIPLTHAEFCRPGVDAAHRQRIHTALTHADGLIANSQDTLDVLAAEAKQAGLPLPASVVARLAPAITTRTPHPAPIAQPYFVVLGTIEPRKNHWFLLQVWRRLVERHGAAAPKLVVIGRRGWECENAIDMLDRCTHLQGAVIELHGCSDEDLRTWMQHAQALLFPSFVEGYGMPLVEALALGVPVIASDLGVFREIADNIPDYLDPLDGPGWLASVEAYAAPNNGARATQLVRIERFSAPSWADHFEAVDQFLASLN